MTAGVSHWWATPSSVERHFSNAELLRSARYHDQLRRVGLASSVAKLVLLAVAALLAARISDGLDGGFDENWHRDTGWLGGPMSARVLLGACLAVLAIRVPATAADAWFEFRFRRGEPDYKPVPALWFVATTCVLAIGSFVGLAVVAGLSYRLVALRRDWALIFGLLTVLVLAAAAAWERVIRQMLPTGETAIDPASSLATELRHVAERFGLEDLPVNTVANGMHGDLSVPQTPNAYSAGLGRNRRVVLTDALVNQGQPTRDFVVAHELSHIKKHHVLLQSMVGAAASLIIVALLAASVEIGWPWEIVSLHPFDPSGLPMVLLLVAAISVILAPGLSWLSRVHERAADSGAIKALGPLPADLARLLYVTTTVDLDPPWWVKLFTSHPAPAERLEFLDRAASKQASSAHDQSR